MIPTKTAIRAARLIQQGVQARRSHRTGDTLHRLDHVRNYFDSVWRTRRSLENAQRHNWPAALQYLEEELLSQVRLMQSILEAIIRPLERPALGLPSLRQLLEELHQIEGEFGDFAIKLKERTISATTEPITLEGISLGRFRIELHVDRLRRQGIGAFEIVALDPNPAASNEAVTHPHVNDSHLCAGDATIPLERALEEGRIADAFCLVRAVLDNYNPANPYVALESWNGPMCHDCGISVEDEAWRCDGCDHELCDDCRGDCLACDTIRCTQCLGRCSLCDVICCRDCLVPVGSAQRSCCPDCRMPCLSCDRQWPKDEIDTDSAQCHSCLNKSNPNNLPSLPEKPHDHDIPASLGVA